MMKHLLAISVFVAGCCAVSVADRPADLRLTLGGVSDIHVDSLPGDRGKSGDTADNGLIAQLEKVAVELRSDRDSCRYGIGDTCVFEVTGVLDTNRTLAVEGSYEYLIDDFGTNVFARGKIDFSKANPFRISSRVSAPGFQRLRVLGAYKLDRFGKPVQRARDWTVAAEPEKLVKGSVTPSDFDAFWDKAKSEVEKVPLDPEMVRIDSRCTKAFDVYAVSFATLGKNRRVYGVLSIPKGEIGRKFPLEVEVPGAGFGGYSQFFEPKEDRVFLKMGVFPWVPGRGLNKLDQRINYENLQAACAARYGQSFGQQDAISYPLYGLDESPESAYFYPVVLGINRAINWALTLESVDRRHVWYGGTSQGGFFGIMLTALNGNFTRAVFFVPAGTDMLGNRQGRADGWPYVSRCFAFDPVLQARAEKHCAYFDAANFASRIHCPCRFVLGLVDETCPPPCVYATYNEVKVSDKAIITVPGMTHSVFESVYLQANSWLQERALPTL